MHVAFAVAMTPVTLGSLVVYVLASNHLISYWWLAVALGWAIVPLAILVRARRYARRVQPAQPCQSFPWRDGTDVPAWSANRTYSGTTELAPR
jgi:hypothetical protein